ncbi:hypothetical protein MRX96_048063 [Rhipicephalus microplus]
MMIVRAATSRYMSRHKGRATSTLLLPHPFRASAVRSLRGESRGHKASNRNGMNIRFAVSIEKTDEEEEGRETSMPAGVKMGGEMVTRSSFGARGAQRVNEIEPNRWHTIGASDDSTALFLAPLVWAAETMKKRPRKVTQDDPVQLALPGKCHCAPRTTDDIEQSDGQPSVLAALPTMTTAETMPNDLQARPPHSGAAVNGRGPVRAVYLLGEPRDSGRSFVFPRGAFSICQDHAVPGFAALLAYLSVSCLHIPCSQSIERSFCLDSE